MALTVAGIIVWTVENAWPYLLGAFGLWALAMMVKGAREAARPVALPALDVAKLDERAQTVRMTDTEREQVAQTLRAAGTDGRLEVDELEERLTKCYAAKRWGEATPLLEDLELRA